MCNGTFNDNRIILCYRHAYGFSVLKRTHFAIQSFRVQLFMTTLLGGAVGIL
jgi:hypothetical protein